MSATAKKIEIRRPDLSREGASLRNSVRAELEWVFRLARKSASAKAAPRSPPRSGSLTRRLVD